MLTALVFCCATSCTTERDRPPLSFDQTARLLVELHLERARADLVREGGRPRSDSVLAALDVGEDDFRATMRYYAQRPAEYVVLMDTVVDRMRVSRPSADVSTDDPVFSGRYGRTMRDTVRDVEE